MVITSIPDYWGFLTKWSAHLTMSCIDRSSASISQHWVHFKLSIVGALPILFMAIPFFPQWFHYLTISQHERGTAHCGCRTYSKYVPIWASWKYDLLVSVRQQKLLYRTWGQNLGPRLKDVRQHCICSVRFNWQQGWTYIRRDMSTSSPTTYTRHSSPKNFIMWSNAVEIVCQGKCTRDKNVHHEAAFGFISACGKCRWYEVMEGQDWGWRDV